ncbi:hypothetical protein OE749_02180 [Aestuariibacter sp. AA17]|uniref:Lipoprotein n=1 Tax=Fluctibacter corallii TaxID=2984329 RepID=A0ABT3A4E2_9ALTE|nr:hypothetical protein [Aestuariibacter sp. AA17]MCV2883505.1 hypothetical protein [Aestuariibacter sp. AA17]
MLRVASLSLLICIFLLSGCATQYPNQNVQGQRFPNVTGESLEGKPYTIPSDFSGKPVLFLIGYKQDSQFDIDRWLIGLDMTKTAIDVYELPTIQGLAPRMFQTTINDGMRAGIPKPLWKGVITIYAGGESVQAFTGNQNPNNARVALLDEEGVVRWFYDEGFAVPALNALRETISDL